MLLCLMQNTNKKIITRKNLRDDFLFFDRNHYPTIFRPTIEKISVTIKNRRQKVAGS